MEKEGLERLYNIWETQNKIEKPVKRELYVDSVDQIASFFALGTFYYFVFNFDTMEVEMVHESCETVLGILPEEYTLDKFLARIHKDDLAKMSKNEQAAIDFLYKKIPTEDIFDYKVAYVLRVKGSNGGYKTILQQSKTIMLSDDDKIQKVFVTHTDVTHLNMPNDNKISFIGTHKPSYYCTVNDPTFYRLDEKPNDLFTPREKEIILYISKGYSFTKIAEEIYLSPHTVNTHKRNILKKTRCKNITEVVAKCIREGII